MMNVLKRDVSYEVGDVVWVYIPKLQPGLSRKLMKFWSGPYLLVSQTGPVNFRVRNFGKQQIVGCTSSFQSYEICV